MTYGFYSGREKTQGWGIKKGITERNAQKHVVVSIYFNLFKVNFKFS